MEGRRKKAQGGNQRHVKKKHNRFLKERSRIKSGVGENFTFAKRGSAREKKKDLLKKKKTWTSKWEEGEGGPWDAHTQHITSKRNIFEKKAGYNGSRSAPKKENR